MLRWTEFWQKFGLTAYFPPQNTGWFYSQLKKEAESLRLHWANSVNDLSESVCHLLVPLRTKPCIFSEWLLEYLHISGSVFWRHFSFVIKKTIQIFYFLAYCLNPLYNCTKRLLQSVNHITVLRFYSFKMFTPNW